MAAMAIMVMTTGLTLIAVAGPATATSDDSGECRLIVSSSSDDDCDGGGSSSKDGDDDGDDGDRDDDGDKDDVAGGDDDSDDGVGSSGPTVAGTEESAPKPVQRPEVKGTEAVPTAVAAGIGGNGPTMTGFSPINLLAQMLVGGGLALLMAVGWMQIGRRASWVDQA